MTADLSPLRLLLVTLAGWVNRHQQEVIEYLVEENRVLREQLKGRRVRLTDDQRRRLAAKGQPLGRRILRRVATIVTPDTILRWHQRLIARKWTFARKRPGRPGTMREIASLIVRMATDNPAWGYSRIHGALKNLGHIRCHERLGGLLRYYHHAVHGVPSRAPEDMQMMRPLRWRIMCGTAARVHRNVGRRFRRSTKSQSSTFISQILALRLPPTSFTRMSMRPKRSTHVAISRLAGASSVRSPATATAAPPAAVIAAAVLSSP